MNVTLSASRLHYDIPEKFIPLVGKYPEIWVIIYNIFWYSGRKKFFKKA